MHMLLVHFYNIFIGAQVISRAETHDYQFVTFVPYCNVQNLAMLSETAG
jgi:hypothetical protein